MRENQDNLSSFRTPEQRSAGIGTMAGRLGTGKSVNWGTGKSGNRSTNLPVYQFTNLPIRLPGLRRAGPSTPLDKSVQIIELSGLIVSHLGHFVKLRMPRKRFAPFVAFRVFRGPNLPASCVAVAGRNWAKTWRSCLYFGTIRNYSEPGNTYLVPLVWPTRITKPRSAKSFKSLRAIR